MTRLLFDIETNGIDFTDGAWLDRVSTVFCMVLLDLDTGEIDRYYDTEGLRELGSASVHQGITRLKTLGPTDELSGHNIIQFDIPVLRKLHGFEPKCRIYDTLVASRTLHPDRTGGHSLRSWGERFGNTKADHTDFTRFSQEMLKYCEQDVNVNRLVYNTLRQEERDGNWVKALDLEHKIANIIARQEEIGFYFNKEVAKKYIEEWGAELNDIDNFIRSVVGDSVEPGPVVQRPFKINGDPAKRTKDVCSAFDLSLSDIVGPFCTFRYEPPNIGSNPQQKLLLSKLGWKPKYTTPTGAPKIDESIREVGIVGERLFWRNALAHRHALVVGLLAMSDPYGRVHGGANPCGTNTSRMKHMRIVNIPRASSPKGAEIRSLFTVPKNKVLVGYDAASLELRILAHYIGSEEYNARITSSDKTNDAHTFAAAAANSDDRELGKTINYALIYGAGDRRLGAIIGGDQAAGAELRDALYKTIPGLEQLVTKAKSAARKGYLTTLDGRKLYLRERVSPLNTLIQGGGSIFMKTVAVKLDELAKDLQAFKVVDMHDEAQWECPPSEVEALSSYIHEAFDYACSDLKLRCPQEAEIKVGKNWQETH